MATWPTIQEGSSGDAVKAWQGVLGIARDGIFGPLTTDATKAWQSTHNIDPDGVVGPVTWAKAFGNVPPVTEAHGSSVIAVPGIENVSASNLRALKSAAEAIGIPVDFLATVVSFETARTFDPAKRNPYSGAVGLIQFTSPTANRLGTTLSALSSMTFSQQLEYVKAYFAPYRARLSTLADTYLAVFYPSAIGRADDAVIAQEGDPQTGQVYTQNAGFDPDHKGYFTKADIVGAISGLYHSALSKPRIAIPIETTIGIAAVLIAMGIGYEMYTLWRMS